MSPRILIVSYYFPPQAAVGGRRPMRMARELAKRGWEVEVLTTATDIREVRIVPLPLTGPGAQFAPAPDRASRSDADTRLFTGQLWMLTAGAWQVRVAVDGGLGAPDQRRCRGAHS